MDFFKETVHHLFLMKTIAYTLCLKRIPSASPYNLFFFFLQLHPWFQDCRSLSICWNKGHFAHKLFKKECSIKIWVFMLEHCSYQAINSDFLQIKTNFQLRIICINLKLPLIHWVVLSYSMSGTFLTNKMELSL